MIGPVWKHLKLGPKGPTELVVNHMSWDVFFFRFRFFSGRDGESPYISFWIFTPKKLGLKFIQFDDKNAYVSIMGGNKTVPMKKRCPLFWVAQVVGKISKRVWEKFQKDITSLSNGRNIIWYHLASIIIYPKFNAPFCVQFNANLKDLYLSWQQDACCGWFDTMFNPCFVCFVKKTCPLNLTDLTDLTWLGCFG